MERRYNLIVRLVGVAVFVIALFLLPFVGQRCGIGSPVTPVVPTEMVGPALTATAEAVTTNTPFESPILPPRTLATGPGESPLPTPTATPNQTHEGPPPSPTPSVPVYGYQIVATYPHDPGAFTQGLVYLDGVLYEGTGLLGRSTLRRVDLETGQILQSRALSETLFGEGIAVWGERIYQLTWQSNLGLIYDRETFEPVGQWSYEGEGWGLTHDGTHLIMSDGTAVLRFLDPDDLSEVRRIEVHDERGPLANLNELEYINGQVYANVWRTGRIARIDPQSGQVLAWIDLDPLVAQVNAAGAVDVLNGIAYDPEADRLLITGKLWPNLYEIDLVPPE